MNEKVKKVFETFVKKAILLVINSRMKESEDKNGKFSELDLNQSGIRKSSISSDSEFFDVDDLFLDEYDVLSFSKSQSKTFTIDFYAKKKKKKILFERWFISYLKEDSFDNNFNFYYKRLQTLMYSVYSITRLLPGIKNSNQYEIYYKFYQNYKKEKFSIPPVTFFNYNCIEMNKFEFKVEYLSPEKVSRFFEGKVNYYYPDFNINGKIVEIKGDHFFRINGDTGKEEMFMPWKGKLTNEEYQYRCLLQEAKH